ncbi:threonylcarbamoyl-AMP synthase [Eubacteriales bacterium OttesenSCG-928-N13]|nr:threonylcarbamoyl-AMP synthase [Eubacteriales bacterium OttesenSCG-928-N13]
MDTQVMHATESNINRAGKLIRSGQLVAFPTETVYGLGANALLPEAVERIFEAKGRPSDNPLIVHIHAVSQVQQLTSGAMNDMQRQLADAYWPGPLTMVMDKAESVPDEVTAGLQTVGIRMPDHPVARALIRVAGVPIAAPSANLSGRPSPTTAAHVKQDLDGRVPLILDGGACEVGLESTVLDVTRFPPRVLRPGGITPEMIARVVGEVEVDPRVLTPLGEHEQPSSPGMKHRHYAPIGQLTLVTGAVRPMARRIRDLYDQAEDEGQHACILALDSHRPLYGGRSVHTMGRDAQHAAQSLFGALRQMDEQQVDVILAEGFQADGLGLALMNRLLRAASFRIIDAGEDI